MENILVNETAKRQRMQKVILEQEILEELVQDTNFINERKPLAVLGLWLVSYNNHITNAILPNDIENQELNNTDAVLPDSITDRELHNTDTVLPDSNTDGEIYINDAKRL